LCALEFLRYITNNQNGVGIVYDAMMNGKQGGFCLAPPGLTGY
jgi:hypothetical protein